MDVYEEVGVPEFGAPWPAMTMPDQGVIDQFTIFFALFLGGLKDVGLSTKLDKDISLNIMCACLY